MLLGLRHHAVVGCDGEQHQIDAVRAGEHVADEALVAGDVDDTGAGAVGQREVGEAEIDRNPALLFFLEAIGVLPGERLDQRGLAVIDVTGGADDGVGYSRCHRENFTLSQRQHLGCAQNPHLLAALRPASSPVKRAR